MVTHYETECIYFEASFFQLLKPTIECDKLQYKCRDAKLELLSTCPRTISAQWCYMLVIPCALVGSLIYVYTLSPHASGLFIRQTTCAHGITIKYTTTMLQLQLTIT